MEMLNSADFWIGLVKIIWINIILSGDNAVVIALAARSLPPEQQKKAIMFGSGAAVVLRIVLTVVAAKLLELSFLQVIGGCLLLWIGYQLLTGGDEEEGESKGNGSMVAAIRTILIADLVMSLDNVIAVAATAQGNMVLLILGLAISIPLVIFGSTLMIKLMERFPVIVTLGAALLMGELISWRRMLAIAVALLGAMIVLRPGLRELQLGHGAQLGAALAFGSSYLVAKRLSELLPATVVVAMMSLTVCIGLAPLAALNWVPPSLTQCAVLACTAVFATAGHYAMTRAFATAPLTVTQPVTFLQLLWAAALGALAFGEPVDIWVMLGGAIMIGAICYISLREARLRRDANVPPRQI